MLDFDQFFEETLRERMLPYEARRKSRLWALLILPLLTVALISVVYGFQWALIIEWWGFLLISLVIGLIVVAIFWFFFSQRSLPEDVEHALQESIPDFCEGFQSGGGVISFKRFRESRLFNEVTQHYDGENYFKNESPFGVTEFSEIRVGGPVQAGWRDVFWGLFFYSEAMQPFPTPIIILPNKARQGFEHTGDLILAHQYMEEEEELVRVDTSIQSHYAVYAGEDKTARALLDPEFIETLNTLGKSHKAKVAMHDNGVYVAIHLGHNWLQPEVFSLFCKPLTDREKLREYFEMAALGIKLCQTAAGTGGMGGGMPMMDNLPDLEDV